MKNRPAVRSREFAASGLAVSGWKSYNLLKVNFSYQLLAKHINFCTHLFR
jgi:hypothetical protein